MDLLHKNISVRILDPLPPELTPANILDALHGEIMAVSDDVADADDCKMLQPGATVLVLVNPGGIHVFTTPMDLWIVPASNVVAVE